METLGGADEMAHLAGHLICDGDIGALVAVVGHAVPAGVGDLGKRQDVCNPLREIIDRTETGQIASWCSGCGW